DAFGRGRKATSRTPYFARGYESPARSKTLARMDTSHTGTGRSRVHPEVVLRDASGSLRTHADDERTREVGRIHSTGEVPEQSQTDGSGGDGGKESDQRKPEPAKHVPDSAPGRREQCAGTGRRHAAGRQCIATPGERVPSL